MGAPPRNGSPTILVVDDDPELRELLDVLLADEGYRVLLAAHGSEALNLATSEDVDLIVLDLVMPLFDAADVIARHDGR
jgi:two-component system, OmpR family, response regulator VanR